MRRTITVVLFSAMVVFGFSARPVQAAEPAGLRVATFHADVTPPLGSFIYGLQPLETIEHQLLERLRPDDFVAVAGYGEGSPSYICTERAFAEGGYEPAASAVAPESEGPLKAAIRQLLGVE